MFDGTDVGASFISMSKHGLSVKILDIQKFRILVYFLVINIELGVISYPKKLITSLGSSKSAALRFFYNPTLYKIASLEDK